MTLQKFKTAQFKKDILSVIITILLIFLLLNVAKAQVKVDPNTRFTLSPTAADSLIQAFKLTESYMYAKQSQFTVGDANIITEIHNSIRNEITRQYLNQMGDAYIKSKNITKDIEESKKAFIAGLTQNPRLAPSYTGTKKEDYEAGLHNNK